MRNLRRKWDRRFVLALSWFFFIGLLEWSHASNAPREHEYPREYEYIDEIERDYPLRKFKPLQITNVRGDISVQGWSFDKLRIKVRKKVLTASPMKATQLLSAIDYRYSALESNLEISTQYGKNLSIEERIKEKAGPKVRLEILVYAPSQLKLQLWGVDGDLNLKNWAGSAEIRARAGLVHVENFKGNLVTLTCVSCSAQFQQVRGSIRSSTGQGKVELSQVQGGKVYVETLGGAIQLSEVKGEQLYTSKQGSIQGRVIQGNVEFHAENSTIAFDEFEGHLSGYLDKGSIYAQVKKWKAIEQSVIETLAADVSLVLPREFSSTLDVWSKQGNTEIQFPVVLSSESEAVGPSPTGRILGRVRAGGPLLRVFSETGSIKLHRETP